MKNLRVIILFGVVAAFLPAVPAQAKLDLTHGWSFMRDLQAVGTARHWERPALDDRSWHLVDAGKSWTALGYPDGRGYGWYRRWVTVPAAWKGRRVWLVLGGLNDCGTVFCNGRKVNQFGDHRTVGVAESPIIADLTPAVRFGARDLIALRVFDWASNGGLWRLPCFVTADPHDLPHAVTITAGPALQPRCVLVDLDLRSYGFDAPRSAVRVALRRAGRVGIVAQHRIALAAHAQTASAEIPMRRVQPGARYGVTASFISVDRGAPIRGAVSSSFVWPRTGWKKEYAALKVLNNFVTILAAKSLRANDATIRFANPRQGWVFFRITSAKDLPAAHVDGRSETLVWRPNPQTGALEAMLRLATGEHSLRVENGRGAGIDVRTVPEIAYCYFPTTPLIPAYGAYDRSFCEKYVFPDVNTLVTSGGTDRTFMDAWAREGQQWIANAGLPGLDGPVPDPAAVYHEWQSNPGFSQPDYAGMIVDEFVSDSAPHYRAWTEAVRRLHDDPANAGRRFYAWCGDLYEVPAGAEFCKQMLRFGYPLAWERYLAEQPTRHEAEMLILRDIVAPFRLYKQAVPGVEQHMVMTLGYLSAPPETLNRDPSVDYQVFMDMQLRALATQPEFFGLYGVMWYSTRYADEESLRYAHELIRHYCIDGATEPLDTDPYRLDHVANPDFAEGLAGWTVRAARSGTIGVGDMPGFSWLEGRYQRTDMGDRYCRMTRSPDRPNVVSQRIRGLVPGRLYSVKLISADMTDPHAREKVAVSLEVAGAAVLSQYCFQQPFASIYDHQVPPYTRDHPAWMNYHRVVFRATAPTAMLTISDWTSPGEPGGPINHETAVNFVEVEPFHKP